MRHGSRWHRSVALICLFAVLPTTTGCIGLLANLIYAGTGNMVPARFTGLQGRKVAVVCMEGRGSYGPTVVSRKLAAEISAQLAEHVKDVDVIAPQRVEDWIDENDWDMIDYQVIGAGLGAESVVSVDVDSFTLREGATMYKGRADLHIVVYDILANAQEVYEQSPPQIQYPVNAGYHSTEISERDFRKLFLATVARRVSRQFYAYEAIEDYAQDVTLFGAN